MSGLPEVTIAGTLTADPELKFLDSGTPVVNFTLAANDRRRNADTGEWEDVSATFLRCQAWRELAEHISESLARGTRVLATGALKQRSFDTPDGEKRSVFELTVFEIGPSLKWATATVQKATRTGTATALGGGEAWSRPAPAGAAEAPGEPPF